jgi:hypothetical protein
MLRAAFVGCVTLMESVAAGIPASHAESMPSLNGGAPIEVSGFEVADGDVHMLEWLGRGTDFRQFVVRDVETELVTQDKGSRLLSVACKTKPEYKTYARPNNDGTALATLTRFSVTFPLVLRVRASNGRVWRLDVKHNYYATNLDTPGKRNIKLNFEIVKQNAE